LHAFELNFRQGIRIEIEYFGLGLLRHNVSSRNAHDYIPIRTPVWGDIEGDEKIADVEGGERRMECWVEFVKHSGPNTAE
jgi:hypothetical protein